jgi:phosphomannomutase
MNNPIKFGTDGWRAVIADDFTFANVRFCAQGAADYLKQKGLASRGVYIGYDRRFASEDFAAAAAEVLAGNGIHVLLSPKAIPTPFVSFGVITKKAGGGIAITASHNPARWNGFKFREETGASVSSETSLEVEKHIDRAFYANKVKSIPLAQALQEKSVEYFDLTPSYLASINKLIDIDSLRHAGLKIAVDSMYGVGSGYFKTLLSGGSTNVIEINSERGPLVKTITSTSMLDRLGELYKVPVYETPVGFKYVAPVMIAQNALIGGEESGGYGFRGHIPERDAIPAGLYFLDFMVKTGKTPSQLLSYLYSKVGEHYYDRIDLHFPEEKRQAIINRVREGEPKYIENIRVARVDTQDGFRFILADNSWLLIRFSGTEPILRIYAETNDTERLKRMLQFGRELAGV